MLPFYQLVCCPQSRALTDNFIAVIHHCTLSLAAIFQIAGSSGAAMLAPFFMKDHGYSIAAASVPLVVNGVGRVCSDLISGVMASYFSSGSVDRRGHRRRPSSSRHRRIIFIESPVVFLGAFTILGVTEAMFALSIRKIAFEQSEPGQQGRVQGQVAAALGIGFSLGPLLGGFVGKRFGPQVLFAFYALPQVIGLILILSAAPIARVPSPKKPRCNSGAKARPY